MNTLSYRLTFFIGFQRLRDIELPESNTPRELTDHTAIQTKVWRQTLVNCHRHLQFVFIKISPSSNVVTVVDSLVSSIKMYDSFQASQLVWSLYTERLNTRKLRLVQTFIHSPQAKQKQTRTPKTWLNKRWSWTIFRQWAHLNVITRSMSVTDLTGFPQFNL